MLILSTSLSAGYSPLSKPAIIGYWGSAADKPALSQLPEALKRGYNVISLAFGDTLKSDGSFEIHTNLGPPPSKKNVTSSAGLPLDSWHYVLSFGGQNAAGPSVPDTEAYVAGFMKSYNAARAQYGFDGIDIDIETGMTTPLLRALRKIFAALHADGQVISMAPQPLNIDPGEVKSFMEGGYNCYVPLVDSTIIDTVTYIAPQLYNNPMPLGNLTKYILSMQAGAKISWDGQDLVLNIPSSKLVFGYPAARGAAPAGPSQPWEADPATLASTYKASPALMSTGGVMTWSIGWDATTGWKWIEAVKTIWSGQQAGTMVEARDDEPPAAAVTAAAQETAAPEQPKTAAPEQAATPKRPHLIFSLIDDLGWNDVGWHDAFGQIKTPKLDALRSESVALNNYYVYRFCSPSRSQILTGRYAWHLGQQTEMNLNPMPGIACGIDLKFAFLPAMLKQAGYATWALGKWHQGFLTDAYTPTLRGFDSYLGYYSGAEEHFSHEKVGYPPQPGHKGGYTAYDLANSSGTVVRPCLGAVGNASATYSAFLYANETLRLLDAHDPSVPLFVYLAWNNVHDPNEAPPEYVARHPTIADMPRRQLAGMMSALDDTLTAVIDGLKAKQMWDDTLLVVSTDNGGNLGGSGYNWPLRGGKYTWWQGGVRGVGMVAGGKNLLPDAVRGGTYAGAIHQVDWYTTFAGLAGIADPSDGTGPVPVDGVDVYSAIVANASSPRAEVVLQLLSDAPGNSYELPPREFCDAVAGRDEEQHCVPPRSALPALPAMEEVDQEGGFSAALASKAANNLKQGAIMSIEGEKHWKLLVGYPGWKKQWDGWLQPPSAAEEEAPEDATAASVGTPYNGTLCVASPCLFEVNSDPLEKTDVATQHPKIVKRLHARLVELLAGEVTLADSGLCPTPLGTKPDARMTALAIATGFWQPWLNESTKGEVWPKDVIY